MKKQSRYFLIGGNEPDEIDEEIKDVVGSIDNADEDTIDKIISYIRDNIDDKSSEGVQQFGKREYIKKVLTILESDIQPVIPKMSGGISTDDIQKINRLIVDTSDKLIKYRKLNSDEYTNKIRASIKKTLLESKFEILDKEGKIPDDITSTFIKDLNENVFTDDPLNENDSEVKNIFENYKSILGRESMKDSNNIYISVVSILKSKKDIYEKFKPFITYTNLQTNKDISFANMLTLYNYNHILALTKEGYKQRDKFAENKPTEIKDKSGKPVKWSADDEVALRAENFAVHLFRSLYEELKDFPYENFAQIISTSQRFEDIDIKLGGIGAIEMKGHRVGSFKFGKLVGFTKLYDDKKPDQFFAFGQVISTMLPVRIAAETNGFDKFNGLSLNIIPRELIMKLKDYERLLTFLDEVSINKIEGGIKKVSKELILEGIRTCLGNDYDIVEYEQLEILLPKKAQIKLESDPLKNDPKIIKDQIKRYNDNKVDDNKLIKLKTLLDSMVLKYNKPTKQIKKPSLKENKRKAFNDLSSYVDALSPTKITPSIEKKINAKRIEIIKTYDLNNDWYDDWKNRLKEN